MLTRSAVLLALLPFIILAGEPVLDEYFPDATPLFTFSAPQPLIDMAVDSDGSFYLIYEKPDSIAVQKLSSNGEPRSLMTAFLGVTPNPELLHIEVSNAGEKTVVWGIDTELDTPINWVFDTTGRDILHQDNVLKYAEWLQVSPGGGFFACQGYRDISTIPAVFTDEWDKIDVGSDNERRHGYFVGTSEDGEDLLLLTEPDSNDILISLTKLPSRERVFETRLGQDYKDLVAHRTNIAVTENYYILQYTRANNRKVTGFRKDDGKFDWSLDPLFEINDIAPSLNGKYVGFTGYFCMETLTETGIEIAYRCDMNRKPPVPLYWPGFPEITVWNEYGVLAAALNFPDSVNTSRTTIVKFDRESVDSPQMLPYRIEGFRIAGTDFVAIIRDSVLEIFELPPK